MRTLLLDRDRWDLVVGADHNIAVADEPYASAQDVASACRGFRGECWFDKTLGIPYFQQILGRFPPFEYLKTQWVNAALSVPNVASAKAFISSVQGRVVTGQVQITDIAGTTSVVGAASAPGFFILGVSELGGPDVLA